MPARAQVGTALTGLWYWVYGLPGDSDVAAEAGSPHLQNVAAMRSTVRLVAAVVGVMALAYIGFLLRG